ncbi:hypothetical protein PIB30_032706 [Stylosanthes scabra]|uniref:Uncharacterized protein n=1 Tax=Stylosanthes scabra TaxID=79078 RepID=A0ABU6RCF6_9FABA|nr:hypothetical protein [Stylosanthes scabra]
MEKMVEVVANNNDESCSIATGIGNKFSDLKKSFNFALRSLLTSCSNQDFNQAFSTFTDTETQLLHRLFLQVITSLHENIEEEFDSICLRTQVGAALDAVEEVIEERDLDPLFSDRSYIMDVAEDLCAAKKNEIQRLTQMVQLGEENNQMLKSRLQLLREGKQVLSGASEAVEKFRSMNLRYEANISDK